MSRFKNEQEWKLAKFTYDFAVDAGAQGVFTLAGEAFPVGTYIRDFYSVTKVAPTSGGAATVTVGYNGDADADSGDTGTLAYSAFTVGAVSQGNGNGASRTWDDTNDRQLYHYVDAAAKGVPQLTLGTADLTAGKVEFYYEYWTPQAEL